MSGRLLADILAAGRESYNARFAAVRAAYPMRDPERFADHLRGPFLRLFGALVEAGGAASEAAAGTASDAARYAPAVDALYGASLDLFRAGLLADSPAAAAVRRVWEELLPAVPALVLAEPRPACAALCNAASSLIRRAPDTAERWMAAMRDTLAAAGFSIRDPAALRDLALVLAWQSGLPQYRDGAIGRWLALPETLQVLSLRLGTGHPPSEETAERLRNPWWNPGAAQAAADAGRMPALVAHCGGFRGFGGPFRRPPLVTAHDGRLFASDGEGHWEIHADLFGTALLPVQGPCGTPRQEPGRAGADTAWRFLIESDGTVARGAAKAAFPQLAGWSSRASDGWTLAVTLPDSHFVYLVGAP